MKLQHATGKIIGGTTYAEAVSLISSAAMLCYNVQEVAGETAEDIFKNREAFVEKRLKAGHESVIEHSLVACLFQVDRGVTHEIVRHRLCSFTQSSTRYCDYASEREDGNVTFIIPPWVEISPGTYNGHDNMQNVFRDKADMMWFCDMLNAETSYRRLRENGWAPEKARCVLPHSTMANIMWSANLREWRHILNLRAVGTTGRPHPQMVEVMQPLLQQFKQQYPIFFNDINVEGE